MIVYTIIILIFFFALVATGIHKSFKDKDYEWGWFFVVIDILVLLAIIFQFILIK